MWDRGYVILERSTNKIREPMEASWRNSICKGPWKKFKPQPSDREPLAVGWRVWEWPTWVVSLAEAGWLWGPRVGCGTGWTRIYTLFLTLTSQVPTSSLSSSVKWKKYLPPRTLVIIQWKSFWHRNVQKCPSFTFWGNSILFSTVAVPVCIPTNNVLGFPFLRILSNICLWICLCWPFWLVWDDTSLWF